jgi:hypothetical protein
VRETATTVIDATFAPQLYIQSTKIKIHVKNISSNTCAIKK